MDNDTKKTVDGKVQTPQTDRKLTANSLAQTDHQPTGKSVGTDLAGYVKTDQVAKIIGVTKPAVEKWRKLGWFRADLVDHNGVYWYTAVKNASIAHTKWAYWNYSRKQPPVTFFYVTDKQI